MNPEQENAELKARLAEAEDTLRAIRGGEVDALVCAGPHGDQVFTLQGAESTYRFLVEEMNEGALLLGPEGTVLYANARFAGLAGMPLEQVIGTAFESFFVPAERLGMPGLLAASRAACTRTELHLMLTSGEARPVSISLCTLKRQNVEGYSVVVADLTERKAAESALHEVNAQLSERTAKLQEMVNELQHVSYSIIHDMRAPLRAMQGFAALLEGDLPECTEARRKEYCRLILVGAKRVDMQITDALQYTKAVLQHLPMGRVMLANVIQDLLETYPNLHPEKADISVEGPLPAVIGNESLLTQCFANILNNAVKFVVPGTRPRVRIWAEAGPGAARIWVEDNGIGIPKAAQARLFGLFERLAHGYEGTGVGLAIVRKVVERMGGKVGVESEDGKGSRFWVDLQAATISSVPGASTSREIRDGGNL
jgi:PAS domain S-box-containing protein